ncbi:penicillin-binding protein 2 [Psychrobium sp. 1_MG-2023]|uniref:peptidoglycan D,D-transpeptidase FtsI family protein n=1 Tax=Psychrobium sp. 1_MG-2023 TaxID=3062624 RepID=UPI000C32A319|nr:penicillin-binding transpeptidase domain-containing protein [Psychrobium sp. 1_MG-2023]MDP2561456.1 penicillin-binding transpeptidase domain-containing protein [Psychrobium sp. 1_MG-2023]PKF57723.1 peptidoglycan glycosyltransferase FtsI [Alteromonadales bacterium alter-6D02]
MSKQAKVNKKPKVITWRLYLVVVVIIAVFVAIASRAAFLQVIESENLKNQGDRRSERTIVSQSHRGNIVDRHGTALAVSVPVQIVWSDPKIVHEKNGLVDKRRWQALADVLDRPVEKLLSAVKNPNRRFVYLKRQVSPAQADYIKQLKIPGIFLKPSSRRYYPTGEITAHVVGYTNIDDEGKNGIERSFDEWLTGEPTKRKVRKSRDGMVVERLSTVEEGEHANDVVISIDQRIQAIAYKELKTATEYHRATSGSVVVLDVKTGEILAMVNTPSYNPNNRRTMNAYKLRNRAITDTFEPGSTIKPLAAMTALDFGEYKVDSMINTSPGWYRLGANRIRDPRNLGKVDIATIIAKSSNVGISKLALSVPKEQFLTSFYAMGFGSHTNVTLPVESPGVLRERRRWSDFELATLSFGYGMAVTPLQLARAYSVIANDGKLNPISILKLDKAPQGEQVVSPEIAQAMLQMMEGVTKAGGTALKARIGGYRVAGKTGTARKAVAGGYGDDYVVSFAGIAPIDNPRLVTIVIINEPKGDKYYGGDVAAPVFAKVTTGALQLLNVAPSKTVTVPMKLARLSSPEHRSIEGRLYEQ